MDLPSAFVPRATRAVGRFGFGLAAAVLLGLGVMVVIGVFQLRASDQWITHTFVVKATLTRIETLQERATSRARLYFMLSKPQDLVDYRAADKGIRRSFTQLVDLVADNPPQQARARRLSSTLDDRLGVLASTVRIFERAGDLKDHADLVESGDALHRSAVDQIARMIAVEDRLLAEREDRSRRAAIALAAAGLVGLPFSLLTLFIVNRRLIRENSAREATQSDLESSVGQLRQLSNELYLLGEHAGALQSAASIEEAVQLSARMFQRLWPQHAGTLYLIKASRDHADAVAQWGTHCVPTQSTPAPNDCWAIRRHHVYVSSLPAGVACAHVHPPASGDFRTVCAPMASQGEVHGWIYLSSLADAPEVSESALQTAAEQLSSILGSLRLREALKREAIRDPLTSLYNRRYLEEGLVREMARCARRRLPLTLLMIDLDHFKSFNDNHGHAAGDAILVAFSETLRHLSRSEDIACRHGGEEFVLVMPEADLATAAAKAELIRVRTSELRVRVGGGDLPPLTVSIGVAAMTPQGELPSNLLRVADEALYRAKHSGRNRVEVATPA